MEQINRIQLKKEMNDLAHLSHKRESESELEKLLGKFQEWKNGKLDYDDLNGIILDTHDIIGRNIWKAHDFDDDFIVIRALYKNIITKEELSPELYESLKGKIDALKKILG